MSEEKFCMAALATLDGGRCRAAFDDHIRRCVEDMVDRPGDKRSRKVTLVIEMKPVQDEDGGGLDEVVVAWDAKDTVPTRRSKVYNMAPRKGLLRGKPTTDLWFNELSPDDANQRTIDELEEEQR